ncbi:SLBB domain-containing protein [bacterium]|nr:SLBB domain-containing protein [candidate division CSSED10-310 bacterium]
MRTYRAMLMVCTGTGCVAGNSFRIKEALEQGLRERCLDNQYLVVATGCNGFCAQGPIMVVQPEGVFYKKLTLADVNDIIDQHLVGGRPVERLFFNDPSDGHPIPKMQDIRFFNKQVLIALRNKGVIDPESLESYLGVNGYAALEKVLTTMTPEAVVQEVLRSGIRGRGGGGFPTGIKWRTCREAVEKTGRQPVLVCNADEGDPGAFMDRSIIEADPYAVLEGMTIGAYAIGAEEGFIYIRKEYPLALVRLNKAIQTARQRGLLGAGILGTDFSFDIKVHRGAGAFVCGESSALMTSLEGRPGEPRAKYVHSVEAGYKDRPTVLNNVETYANIPMILVRGAEWFASIGTGDVSGNPWNGSSGTKVFSLVGNVTNSGLVEVPMGITLREIIFDIGGGIPNGRRFKAVQTGGPSGGCLPAQFLDQPVDFDTLTRAGSMMGSGGMIVMDDHTCMVDVAKYFVEFLKDESCGKCTPCREGCTAVAEILGAITRGEGSEDMLHQLEELCSTMAGSCLCQLGATAPNPVLSTLRYFKDEYLSHIRDRKCPAGVCKALITYRITEACTGCHVCFKGCPTRAITGDVKHLHVINQDMCIKCGVCMEVCRFDAVAVE